MHKTFQSTSLSRVPSLILSIGLAVVTMTGCQMSFVDVDHDPAHNGHAEIDAGEPDDTGRQNENAITE